MSKIEKKFASEFRYCVHMTNNFSSAAKYTLIKNILIDRMKLLKVIQIIKNEMIKLLFIFPLNLSVSIRGL
jgi:hypothetical protein